MNIEIVALHSPQDKTWREWIRCKGKNLPKVFTEILNSNLNMKFSHPITEKMFKDWKSGRSTIPLWVIHEICEHVPQMKEEILDTIETLKIFGSQETHLP